MNKEKDDTTSVESSEGKKKVKRLDGMLESMNSRSDPLSTHRIATEYFQTFKAQRNINEVSKEQTTAVPTAQDTVVNTVVGVRDDELNENIPELTDLLHTISEDRVYRAIKLEIDRGHSDSIRIGLTKLKQLTGLSDKTIRVAIHSLENKKSIRIVEPSVGIYGRKYKVLEPEEIIKERENVSLIIDETTKSIIPR